MGGSCATSALFASSTGIRSQPVLLNPPHSDLSLVFVHIVLHTQSVLLKDEDLERMAVSLGPAQP